jgi:NAD(P)-dependent dehydrogenase (short-subunit alcohol dehydrogenase family)
VDVKDRVVLITGGSTGIGRCTAELLGAQGARLVLAARRRERLDPVVDLLQERGAEVLGLPTDIGKLEEVERLADAAYEKFGRIDIALFNAGASSSDSLLDPDLEVWKRSIDGNLYGLLHSIKAFVPRMVEQGEPCAVYATTSGAGIHGTKYQTAPYATVKNAQLSIMESLYGQVRERGLPIQVGVIVPPLTRTNLAGDDLSVWEQVAAGLSREGKPAPLIEPEEFAEVILAGIREDRFWIEATPEDDERYFGGRYAGSIRSSRKRIRAKAEAMATYEPPDSYLW